MSSASHGSNLLPRTPADDPAFLPVCLDDGTLLYYDGLTSASAWIAMQDPIDVRDYR